STDDQAINLADPSGGTVTIASKRVGKFTSLGPAPGVSADGRVVVFIGDRGNGPGVFAKYRAGGKWSDPVRIAGEGLDGFSSFDTTSAVQVAGRLDTGERGLTVAFVGTYASAGEGLYSSRLGFFGESAADFDPDAVQSVLVNGVVPVAK